MPYCAYLRKSRADLEAEAHGEGETLLRHEKALLDLAKRMKIDLTKIYREVVSGETITARPVMQQVLSEVEQGLWDGVLVMEVERLARGDTIDQGTVAQAFKFTNTKIITPVKTYDPSNEFDEEYFEFGLFMSRREFKTINRRIQRGRIASVNEGKYISSIAPYGYERIKIVNDKGYTLKINTEQSKVVQLIYNLYTEGELQEDGTYKKLGSVRIARKLDSLGIKPMIKETWARASIQDILKNPVYIGKIRWQYRKEIKQVQNGIITKTRPNASEYTLVKGLHEPIIDDETFYKAQKILSKRTIPPVPGSNVLKNPLTGLIYCGKCGTLLTRLAKTSKTPYDAIKCPNVYCDNISSPLYLVENVIINELEKWLSNFKFKWDTEKLDLPYSQAINEKNELIEQLNSQLNKLNEQLERTYSFLEQGIYTTEIFTDRHKKLNFQIQSLENAISALNNEIKHLQSQADRNDVFIPKVEHLLDVYNNLHDAESKNELLKNVLERVEYKKEVPNKKGSRDICNFTIDLYPKVVKY